MPRYSPELKNSIIVKMMPPENKSITQLVRETGVPEATLNQWRKKARAGGCAAPADNHEAERWSPQDKFLIVVEAAGLNEVELAVYCRSKGLFVEQVQAWRDACMQANGGVAKESARHQHELKQSARRIKELERQLHRKNEALAETAALLVLRKKANAIWGDGADA